MHVNPVLCTQSQNFLGKLSKTSKNPMFILIININFKKLEAKKRKF